MQNRMSSPTQFVKSARRVEISKHWRNSVQTQKGSFVRRPAQAQQPIVRLKQGRRAQGNVAAADN